MKAIDYGRLLMCEPILRSVRECMDEISLDAVGNEKELGQISYNLWKVENLLIKFMIDEAKVEDGEK